MKISKKQIEYAIEALRANNIITNDNQYPKVFKGYISSFGAAVIQSGLIPAIIFFENEDNNANADRHKIIGVLKDIINAMRQQYTVTDATILVSSQIPANYSMAQYIIEHGNTDQLLKEITEAAVAMKLALRMYKSE